MLKYEVSWTRYAKDGTFSRHHMFFKYYPEAEQYAHYMERWPRIKNVVIRPFREGNDRIYVRD